MGRTLLPPPPHQRSPRVSLKHNLEACLLELWVRCFAFLCQYNFLNNGRGLIEDLPLPYVPRKGKPLSAFPFSGIRGF